MEAEPGYYCHGIDIPGCHDELHPEADCCSGNSVPCCRIKKKVEATAGSQHSEMEEPIGQRDGLRRIQKERGENKSSLLRFLYV